MTKCQKAMSDDGRAMCDCCKKKVKSELDVPNGWYAVHVEFGLDDTQGEEDCALVCSVQCAKDWIDVTFDAS